MERYVSKVNITRVLRTIYLTHGLSRVEIARILDINKSTVSKIVSFLEELGIVETAAVGEAGPTGGRRPLHLRIRADWGCVMGLEIQTEAFTVVGVNLQGEVFFSHTEPLDLRTVSLVDAFIGIVDRFRPSLENTGMPILGIGVGLPGFVDPVRGVLCASMPFEQYEEINFVREARERLGIQVPVLVDNDANCGCWGELAFRHSSRPGNFIFVLGEHRKHTIAMDNHRIMALGLGLVLNGQVHHGETFSAGEFRSILYKEDQVNQFSISDDQARQFLQNSRVNEMIVDELARHIAFLVNILNLRKVVIGGPIEVLADQIQKAVRNHAQTNWAYPQKVDFEMEVSRLGERAVAYGAAGMYLERLIRIPSVETGTEATAAVGIDLLPQVGQQNQLVRR
ncbi:transcriptional regulator, MarR family [Alkalispirochaeta americana]|uniref:Transcriptional regulator, MarR family n=1 Tax=Alkalispirochaeta americana TaxID=159291 RepID=A0A1N6RYQ8_9SPIO|nr:ROK family transcriptional regulator [Alkalispirochaeta americana]SIQ33975.1 transcriptional regulator, MarR family [Alkalispirochaeta americana]